MNNFSKAEQITTVYGKFFPAKEGIGTPCYKEATLRGRRLPKYGTVLFGAYLVKQSFTTFKINNFETDNVSRRLVLELSVNFREQEDLDACEANWNNLVKSSDSEWLSQVKLKTFYSLSFDSSSFFIPMRKNDEIEQSLSRFTRKSSTKWGGKAISFVVKADCSSITEHKEIDERINHDSVIDASLMRLKMLKLVPQDNLINISTAVAA